MAKENTFMELWNKLKVVPTAAKKLIDAGRQKGLTSINPTWQKEIMTQTFGPITQGWMVRYVREPNEYCEATGEMIVNLVAYVKVKFKDSEGWSEEVQGFGSCKLCAKERSGMFFDDDAFKKAATDALGNALQYFGVGADVRYKNTEENKYTANRNIVADENPPQNTAQNVPLPPVLEGSEVIKEEQAKHLETLITTHNKSIDSMLTYLNRNRPDDNKAKSINEVTYEEYCDLIHYFH